MGTAIEYSVPDRVKLSFVILTSGHSNAQPWESQCPDVKNYKWRLNPVWHAMLYSCTYMATVGVKGLCTKITYNVSCGGCWQFIMRHCTARCHIVTQPGMSSSHRCDDQVWHRHTARCGIRSLHLGQLVLGRHYLLLRVEQAWQRSEQHTHTG